MQNPALVLLQYTAARIKQKSPVFAPCLRRQVAGSFDNPYDMDHPDNLDLKIFCTEYERHYGTPPASQLLFDVATFPCIDNLLHLQRFKSRL